MRSCIKSLIYALVEHWGLTRLSTERQMKTPMQLQSGAPQLQQSLIGLWGAVGKFNCMH